MSSGLQTLTAIAIVIMALAVVVLAAVVVAVVLELKRTQQRVEALIGRAEAGLTPLLGRMNEITDNVQSISKTARSDLDSVSETIQTANDTVRDAVSVTQDRLNDFTALLGVVQEEAEGLFVSTASTIRGVQRGAAVFGRRSGTDLASEELDAAESADDLDIKEEGDGHDDDTEPTAEAPPAAPRIRPRSRSRRHA
jgi:flagellar basal body-associated protein FliL